MRRARIHLVAALLVVSALVVAGCGDDDEPAGERAATVRTEPGTATEAIDPTTAEATATEDESTDDSSAGDLPDACELLDADDVKEAAGRDVAPQEEKGETVDGFRFRQCNWTAVGHYDSAAVRVVSGTRRYDTLLRDLTGTGAPITKLDGLGDAAFTAPGFSGETAGGSRGATVFVKAAGKTFSLALANAQGQGPRDELESLMREMLSRAG